MSTVKETVKKVYVVCGMVRWVGTAIGPVEACVKALQFFKGSQPRTLDGYFFSVDERGFRIGPHAQWAVPVDDVLKKAGYVYDDPDSGEQCAL
jgi:hypothetical protein